MKLLYHEVHRSSPDASWVVFVHGAGGNTTTWDLQLPAFKQHYNCLLLDLRDHGKSKGIDPAYEKYEFRIISEDIKKLLDHLQIEEAAFVTLSLGSILLQDFAARYPGLVKAVVFAGAIFKGNLLMKVLVKIALFLNLFLPFTVLYRIFSRVLMPRQKDNTSRNVYMEQAAVLTQQEFDKWLGLHKEFFRLIRGFFDARFKPYGLVVMGSDDYVFLGTARDFAETQLQVELCVIKGAGHICNIDAPVLFNQVSLRFLDKIPGMQKIRTEPETLPRTA